MAKHSKVKKLTNTEKRIYQVFGSGSHNYFYDKFMNQDTKFNNGLKLGLLRSTYVRMTSYFYCMHHCLLQRSFLLDNIHTPMWYNKSKTDRAHKLVADIEI